MEGGRELDLQPLPPPRPIPLPTVCHCKYWCRSHNPHKAVMMLQECVCAQEAILHVFFFSLCSNCFEYCITRDVSLWPCWIKEVG